MTKRIIAGLLGLFVLFSLSSCNQKKTEAETSRPPLNVVIPGGVDHDKTSPKPVPPVSGEPSQNPTPDTTPGTSPDPVPPKPEKKIPSSVEELRSWVMKHKRYNESYLEDRVVKEINAYVASNAAILLRKVEFSGGRNKVTAYVADLYLEDIRDLLGVVLTDEEGYISKGSPEDVIAGLAAQNMESAFIINTDFMRHRDWGLYVRAGQVWKSEPTKGIDVCAFNKDGSMEILDGDTLDPQKLMAENKVWHVLTFGPSLLNPDGSARNNNKEFRINDNYQLWDNDTSSVGFLSPNPRTAIGQAEDGHYIIVAVDGRDKGYSKGMTFPEISHFMHEEGAEVAYNLDGGGSVFMYFNGRPVNQNTGGRHPSDYFVIVKKKQ